MALQQATSVLFLRGGGGGGGGGEGRGLFCNRRTVLTKSFEIVLFYLFSF